MTLRDRFEEVTIPIAVFVCKLLLYPAECLSFVLRWLGYVVVGTLFITVVLVLLFVFISWMVYVHH